MNRTPSAAAPRPWCALLLLALVIRSAPAQEPGSLLWEARPGPRDFGTLVESSGLFVAGNINSAGGAFAFDGKSGRPLWKHAGEQVIGTLAADDTRLFVVFRDGKSGDARLTALDLKTGKSQWSATGDDRFGSEGLVLSGGHVIVMSRDGFLRSYAAADGRPEWQVDWGSDGPKCFTTPTAGSGRVYFGAGAYEAHGRGGDFLWAVDAGTGAVAWKFQPSAQGFPSGCPSAPAATQSVVLTTLSNAVIAFDVRNGGKLWSRAVTVMSGGYPKPQVLSPATAGAGSVFAASGDTLFRWSAAHGEPLGSWPMTGSSGNPVPTMMSIRDGVLYFVGQMGEDAGFAGKYPLHAMDIDSGRILWRHRVNREVRYENEWGTVVVLPVADGVYYENARLVAKAAR